MEKRLEKLHLEEHLVKVADCHPFAPAGKAAFENLDAAEKAELLTNAEKIAAEEIPVLPMSAFMRFMREGDGNRTKYERYYFDRRIYLMQLLAAECAEGKGRFLDKIVDYMWAIMEETTWVVPAHNRPMDRGSVHANLPDTFGKAPWYFDLFAAETADLLSAVWYFLGPELEERCGSIFGERVEYELRTRIIKPYLAAGDTDLHWLGHLPGIKPNNWTPWITASILTACAVMVKEEDERRAFVQKAVRSLDSFIDGYFPDGGCPEGPHYWSAASAALFDAMETLDAMTGRSLPIFADAKIKAMMEFGCNMFIHREYITNYGDSGPTMKVDVRLFARMGERFGSGRLSAFAGAYPANPVLPAQHRPVRMFRDLLYKVPETKMPFIAEKSTVYEGIGLAVLRENEKTDKGFTVWTKGGTNNESHGHRDIGNVAVYYNGEPMLIDVGIGEYTRALFGKERLRQFGTDTRDHNLPLIDGVGQGIKRTPDVEEFLAHNMQVTDSTFYVELDRAYKNRDIICQYVRQGEITPDAFTLRDKLVLQEEKEITFAFHSIMPMELCDEQVVFQNGITATFGGGFAAKVEKHEFPDTTYKEKWQRDSYYKLTLSAQSKAVDLCMEFRKNK